MDLYGLFSLKDVSSIQKTWFFFFFLNGGAKKPTQ